MKNLFWTAYSNEERHSAINTIQRVISKYGNIVDFKHFSDLSLTMTIEIEAFKVDQLHNELRDNMAIDKVEHLNSTSRNEKTIYLNITFIKGTGSHTIEVPAVPG